MSPISETSVLNAKKIRKQSIPYMWVWAAYYAWVIAFTVWWTAVPSRDMAFSAEYRSLIHTVNMISSAVWVFVLHKERVVLSVRIGASVSALSLVLFFTVPSAPLRVATAVSLGASLGCVNISVLLAFIFALNNTEKLYAIVAGHALGNLLPLLTGSMNADAERLIVAGTFAAALYAVAYFKREPLSSAPDNKLIIDKNTRPAIILTILLSTLGAILFLGADKAILNAHAQSPEAAVMMWYFFGGFMGSMLYAAIFALPKMNVHMALSMPFGCLAMGLLFHAFADRVQGMETAFGIFLGMGTAMGMSTVYYVLGVASKKYNSMFYIRLSILIIGIFGGISGVLIGGWVNGTAYAAQISLILTVASSIMVILVLVFSAPIAQVCFDDAWAGDITRPEVMGLQKAIQIVDSIDELEGLGLTPREKEVCTWLLRGLTVRQVSGELGLAFATVNGYYRSLYRKLGINSKAELFLRFGPKSHE